MRSSYHYFGREGREEGWAKLVSLLRQEGKGRDGGRGAAGRRTARGEVPGEALRTVPKGSRAAVLVLEGAQWESGRWAQDCSGRSPRRGAEDCAEGLASGGTCTRGRAVGVREMGAGLLGAKSQERR